MTSAGYLRFPHIRGELLTFIAEEDVWLAPVCGGRAWRLSADGAQASHPRLSGDASAVAWTSWRHGAPEVYLADVDGGTGRRLTYWGDQQTRVRGWTPDGEVLAISATGQPFTHFGMAYAIPVADAPPRQLPFGPVGDLLVEQAATVLLTGASGREPASWKRYRGGTSGRLWVARAGQAARFDRILADLPGQIACPMLAGGRLVFLSDHEGIGNLYSCELDGTGLRRHTDHDRFYVRNPSTDGRRVVYQCAADVWILDDLDGEARQADIALGSPAAGRGPRLISAEDHLGDLSCDHSGQASVVEVRGTVHWLTHRDGPARALAVARDARARLPRVLGTTGHVVWVTDAPGQDALEIAPADGVRPGGAEQEPGARCLAVGALGSVSDLSAAPDGTTVAAAAHDGRLRVVDVATGAVTELAASGDGPVTGLSWSPDSAWLSWSQPGPRPLCRIRMARLADRAAEARGASPPEVRTAGGIGGSPPQASTAGGLGGREASHPQASTVVDVTDGRFIDTDPVFTADGLYLAFLSRRSFDPVYDAHFFDLSFPYGSRPYLVPLAAATPSPFAPLPEGRPVGDTQAKDDADGDRGKAEPRPSTTTVDVDGLPGRVVQVPVAESRYSSLRAVKGGLAWLRDPVAGALGESAADPDDSGPSATLERFDLKRRSCTELVGELDWFDVSGDGSRLVIGSSGEVRVVSSERKEDPGSEGSADTAAVDLSRARFVADPVAQWRHAYDEAGRLMRRDFWVADLADVDWDAVLDDYRGLLDRVGSASDFADLLWEVLGELGTSHAYVGAAQGGSGHRRDRPRPVGLLGADLERAANGSWRVRRVPPGESSDPRARSPLATPGAAVRPGDVLLAVDGQPVDSVLGPGPLLVGAAGKPVELTLNGAGRDESRRVVVVPLRNERRLRYQDWVAGRRRLVRELSGGRAGYLHVPDMMGEGWAHFHRDLRAEMGLDALIVDVRGNRGGHVSELVVEKLARRVIGWDVPRDLRPGTYPQDAPRGPIVALADEFAGSDGDIVTAAIRTLGLGPVVGTRTWGGVIGIEGLPGHSLVDGTFVTVPRYAIWLEGYGWGVENHGVDPDVEVVTSPDDWLADRDPQLETGVRLALEALEARPPATPPDPSERPSRARPSLPPRATT